MIVVIEGMVEIFLCNGIVVMVVEKYSEMQESGVKNIVDFINEGVIDIVVNIFFGGVV